MSLSLVGYKDFKKDNDAVLKAIGYSFMDVLASTMYAGYITSCTKRIATSDRGVFLEVKCPTDESMKEMLGDRAILVPRLITEVMKNFSKYSKLLSSLFVVSEGVTYDDIKSAVQYYVEELMPEISGLVVNIIKRRIDSIGMKATPSEDVHLFSMIYNHMGADKPTTECGVTDALCEYMSHCIMITILDRNLSNSNWVVERDGDYEHRLHASNVDTIGCDQMEYITIINEQVGLSATYLNDTLVEQAAVWRMFSFLTSTKAKIGSPVSTSPFNTAYYTKISCSTANDEEES